MNTTILSIGEIELKNGRKNQGRTLMDATGLPADTLVKFAGYRYRLNGTGYFDTRYRIMGTIDMLEIRHNAGPIEYIWQDEVVIIRDYYKNQRLYSKRVGELSVKYKWPFDVCLAIGDKDEKYKELASFFYKKKSVLYGEVKKLYDGGSNSKEALNNILGMELSLCLNVEKMSPRNIRRLANFVARKVQKGYCD